MAEQPPVGFLGLSDVRTWAFGASIINTVLLVIFLHVLDYRFLDATVSVLTEVIIGIFDLAYLLLLIVNILLSFAILKRNITIIRIWLWTNSAWYIVIIILFILTIFTIENLRITRVTALAYSLMATFIVHTVNHYYKFELRSQGISVPGI